MDRIILFVVMAFLVSSCNHRRTSYVPDDVYDNDTVLVDEETSVEEETESGGFKVAYKSTDNGVKTIHVKLNDAAGFDAIFDTGCSGLLISLQEAMSLVKAGTFTDDDLIGKQQSVIADGGIVENVVFRIKEVTLVDTEGKPHTLYDVPATVVENPGAPMLVGNVVIDQLAEYSYTIDLKNHEIIFQ